MGGGLMQLIAYGPQDIYLTGNPQITFFKVVFKRHTNFSIEPIQQSWNSTADFGRSVTCIINRTGDLISNMHVVISLPVIDACSNIIWGYVNRLGHALINETKVEIGGQLIDEQYGDWLNIWYELTVVDMKESYMNMIGDIPSLTNINTLAKPAYNLYIPLQFWFNRHYGLALPIIALQYHDIRISVQLNDWVNIINYRGSNVPITPVMTNCFLLIDYIYLDSDERKKFAQVSHEYLIEQLQFNGSEVLTSQYNTYKLNFNHPCKYIVWTPHLDMYYNRNLWLTHMNVTNGNWKNATDLFAKLMSISCSTIPPGVTTILTPTIDSSGIFLPAAYCIDLSNNPIKQGGIVSLYNYPTGGFTQTMLSKVKIMWIVDNVLYDISGNITMIQIVLDNGIIISNTLSSQDISIPINILSIGANKTALAIFNLYGISILNNFVYSNFLDGTDNPVIQAKIQLNGHDRFQILDGNYFNYVQPYQFFSNTPVDGINVFSFALKPQEYQPTGTCNFSRIDNASLEVNLGLYNTTTDQSSYSMYLGNNYNSLLNIYTSNYNVLRIMSGMAGLAFVN
jgi:hypothetical protein